MFKVGDRVTWYWGLDPSTQKQVGVVQRIEEQDTLLYVESDTKVLYYLPDSYVTLEDPFLSWNRKVRSTG